MAGREKSPNGHEPVSEKRSRKKVEAIGSASVAGIANNNSQPENNSKRSGLGVWRNRRPLPMPDIVDTRTEIRDGREFNVKVYTPFEGPKELPKRHPEQVETIVDTDPSDYGL